MPRPTDVPADAFGLTLVGDCLKPLARSGQVAVVTEGLPQPGELVVLWPKGGSRPQLKILRSPIVGWPPHPDSAVVPTVEVATLNPPRSYWFWLDQVEHIARVHSLIPARSRRSAAAARAGQTSTAAAARARRRRRAPAVAAT
jgi:hypothetical protein